MYPTTKLSEPYATIESIAQHIKDRYSYKFSECSLDAMKTLVKQVIYLSEQGSSRFFDGSTLLFDDNTRSELDSIPLDETKRAVKQISSKEKLVRKTIKDTVDELVSLLVRKELNWNGFTQSAGHINNAGAIVWGQTLSSELNKKGSTLLKEYNINLMRIKNGSEHRCVRSGRSDTAESLLRLVHFNFLNAWNSSNKPGISYGPNNTIYFQITLISAQGNTHPGCKSNSALDHLLPTDPHPESKSLEAIAAAIKTIWQGYAFVKLKASFEGAAIEYLAAFPIFKNYPLGCGAKHRSVIRQAREISQDGVLRELALLKKVETLPRDIKICLSVIPLLFLVYESPAQKRILDSFWKQCKSLSRTGDNALYYDILHGMKITLTGEDFNSSECLEPHHSGVEFAYSVKLAGLINSAYSFQCKAGCDRAMIMSSFFLTQQQVPDIDWINISRIEDVDPRFVELFDSFVQHLGKPANIASRGAPLFKSSKKPFLNLVWHENC